MSAAVERVLGRTVGADAVLMAAGLDSLGSEELVVELSKIGKIDLPGAAAALQHMPAATRAPKLAVCWGRRAARAPRLNLGLVDFTALQGLLHGSVMAGDLALGNAGQHGAWHLLGDVLLHLSAPVVLGLLRNRVEPYQLGLSVWEALAFVAVFGACVAVALVGL